MKEKIRGADNSPTGDTPIPDVDDDDHPEPVHPRPPTPMASTSTRGPTVTSRGRRAAGTGEDALLANLEERSQQFLTLQQQLVDQLQPEGDRERKAFAEWLRSAMCSLEHSLWRRCQRQLTDVMYHLSFHC